MRLLAHPFRFVGGRVATVDDGSLADVEQRIAVLLTTLPGERELVPSFGVPDPAFVGDDVHAVNTALVLHGPKVRVDRVAADTPAGGYTTSVTYYYSPRDY